MLGVPGLVAEPADKRLVTEDQRSLAFVSQFLLVSGLVRNRRSGISVPRAFPIYTGWCPLAKHVPPLDRNRLSGDGVTNSLYPDFDLVSFKDPCSLSNHGAACFVDVFVCPNSSVRKCRPCTFLLTVRRSPSAPSFTQLLSLSCSKILCTMQVEFLSAVGHFFTKVVDVPVVQSNGGD